MRPRGCDDEERRDICVCRDAAQKRPQVRAVPADGPNGQKTHQGERWKAARGSPA